MNINDQVKFAHLLLYDRKCRSCGETKNLIDGFYRTRKDRGAVASSFSYECKDCTTNRVIRSRKNAVSPTLWEYPDW